MRKFWLLFAQATTIGLALLFVINTLKPGLLPSAARSGVVTLHESVNNSNSQLPTAGFSVAAQKVMPAVVNIFTSTEIKTPTNPFLDDPRFRFFFGDEFDDTPQRGSSLGSGVIISQDGYILTNHHVVETADQIEVALADGRKAKGHIIGSDPETDLAVIKIDLPGAIPAITFGHSDQAQVGDIVLAIGNPFGVGQTVTMGIVSALKRNHLGLNTFENFIQTDAAINPGNSGGALVDANGNLVGINTAIFSRTGGSLGIGFAVPVDTARQVMEALIRGGSVRRGWIGVEPRDLSAELAESLALPVKTGVLITGVLQDGPAARGGLKPGDVVVKVGGKAVVNTSELFSAVASLPPESVAVIGVLRGAQAVDVKITVGERPKQAGNGR